MSVCVSVGICVRAFCMLPLCLLFHTPDPAPFIPNMSRPKCRDHVLNAMHAPHNGYWLSMPLFFFLAVAPQKTLFCSTCITPQLLPLCLPLTLSLTSAADVGPLLISLPAISSFSPLIGNSSQTSTASSSLLCSLFSSVLFHSVLFYSILFSVCHFFASLYFSILFTHHSHGLSPLLRSYSLQHPQRPRAESEI